MNITRLSTPHAPQPVGPYSQATVAGGFVFVSGQIGIDPATGSLVPGGIEAEARQAIRNLLAILASAQCTAEHVARVDVFLADITQAAIVNEIYAGFFPEHALPARQMVESPHLPKGAQFEISCIALHS